MSPLACAASPRGDAASIEVLLGPGGRRDLLPAGGGATSRERCRSARRARPRRAELGRGVTAADPRERDVGGPLGLGEHEEEGLPVRERIGEGGVDGDLHRAGTVDDQAGLDPRVSPLDVHDGGLRATADDDLHAVTGDHVTEIAGSLLLGDDLAAAPGEVVEQRRVAVGFLGGLVPGLEGHRVGLAAQIALQGDLTKVVADRPRALEARAVALLAEIHLHELHAVVDTALHAFAHEVHPQQHLLDLLHLLSVPVPSEAPLPREVAGLFAVPRRPDEGRRVLLVVVDLDATVQGHRHEQRDELLGVALDVAAHHDREGQEEEAQHDGFARPPAQEAPLQPQPQQVREVGHEEGQDDERPGYEGQGTEDVPDRRLGEVLGGVLTTLLQPLLVPPGRELGEPEGHKGEEHQPERVGHAEAEEGAAEPADEVVARDEDAEQDVEGDGTLGAEEADEVHDSSTDRGSDLPRPLNEVQQEVPPPPRHEDEQDSTDNGDE